MPRQDRDHDAPSPARAGRSPEVVVGVIVWPQVADRLVAALDGELPELLASRLPGARWDVRVVEDALVSAPADALDLLEAARDRMLDEDWDLAVVLTGLPLDAGRRTTVAQASPVHGVGLVSVPALGAVQVRHKALDAAARLVSALVGQEEDGRSDDALTARLAQLTGETQESAEDRPVQFAARVLGGNLALLLGMVRANRPWRLAWSLSRALSVAVATGVLVLVTADLWLLSTAYGPVRLTLLGVLAVGSVSVALIVGAGLWERARRRRERRQVALFNAATMATVLIGVLVFYAALLVLALAGAALLVEPGVFAETVGRDVGVAEYVRLAWLTATLAAVGGALGAGLETDDAVRAAAYTRPVGAPAD